MQVVRTEEKKKEQASPPRGQRPIPAELKEKSTAAIHSSPSQDQKKEEVRKVIPSPSNIRTLFDSQKEEVKNVSGSPSNIKMISDYKVGEWEREEEQRKLNSRRRQKLMEMLRLHLEAGEETDVRSIAHVS